LAFQDQIFDKDMCGSHESDFFVVDVIMQRLVLHFQSAVFFLVLHIRTSTLPRALSGAQVLLGIADMGY
jgi:hypothetical protein